MNCIEIFLLFSILILMRLLQAESSCAIQYPTQIEISPIYAKKLGRHEIYLPYNAKNLILRDGETIKGYCRTNFTSIKVRRTSSSRRYYDYGESENENVNLFDQSAITLKCVSGEVHYNNLPLVSNVMECNQLNWRVYDTNEAFEWCEKNENSKTFLFAAKSSVDHHVLAGICFDIQEWSLKTITYNVTNIGKVNNNEMRRDITKTILKGFQSLGEELSSLQSNYFDFLEYDLDKQLTNLSHTNSWLSLAKYELSSLVQGEYMKNYFDQFVDTLNIIWWHNLRIGNWKIFMNTLENYAHNNSFQIYAGTSGAVKIPSKNSKENNILEIQNNYLNKTVPSYIWSYIKSNEAQSKDFVIVGYNSPFAEWFDSSEVVFCPDICSEIPWLKEVSSTFRYATAGVMFCCSPDFVQQTNIFHGLPTDVLSTPSTQKYATVLKQEDNAKHFYEEETDDHSKNLNVEANGQMDKVEVATEDNNH